jgi:hypothetical protein
VRGALILIAVCATALLGAAGFFAFAAGPGGGASSVLDEWSNWPGKVSCGIPFEPLTAFARPADAETGRRGSEIALRRYFVKTRHYATRFPAHEWRVLAESSRYAEFGRGEIASGSIEVMRFARGAKGWHWVGYGSFCRPATIRRGREAITWTLARGQHLGPSTRSVKVELGPGGPCGSRKHLLEHPIFRTEDGALLMTLFLRPVPPPPPGTYEACGELIEPPVKLKLPGELGGRHLYDGGTFPPWPAGKPQPEG